MRKYLVEYEFKTDIGNYYWFPLYINADNESLAEVSAKTVQTALEQHYMLKRRTKVQLIVQGLNAEFFTEHINSRLRGRVEILKFDVWRFKDVPTNPELNFDEHLQLIEYLDSFSSDNIASTIARQRFPVRLYCGDPTLDFKEFLLVNVVDPSNIEDFYIVVEVSDTSFKTSKLKLITEGLWKNAHMKGYKVRVDAPHTPDGKRHVHIAHSKHTSAKSKQVSWNDDLFRHDKKSFDPFFKGLKKAKEIARKELGLDANAILESLRPKGNILLKSIQTTNQTDDVFYFHLQ